MTTAHPYRVALTASLALFLVILDNTIVNVAMVPISHALREDLGAVQWVITAYFLAQASVIPIAGYLSHRVGIKQLSLICLALFGLSSILCGLARTNSALILFRVIQGVSGGALLPLSQAITFSVFSGPDRTKATSIIMVPVLIAPAFGPTLGGWLTQHFGWEMIFFVNVPVVLVALFLSWKIFPEDLPASEAALRHKFDYLGLFLCISGVLAVTYAFTLVGQVESATIDVLHPHGVPNGWLAPVVWEFFVYGLLVLTAFAYREWVVSPEPVLDLHLLRRYEFALASLIAWINAGIFFGSMFLLPVFLQQVMAKPLSPLEAGLVLMPQGVGAAIAVVSCGLLYKRLGVRWLGATGALLLALSAWQISREAATTNGWSLVPWIFIRGLGFGATFQLMQAKAMESVSNLALPKASSLFNVMRQIFSSIGLAVIVTLQLQLTSTHMTGWLRDNAATGSTASGQTWAGVAAFHDIFIGVAIGSVLLFLLTLMLPQHIKISESPVVIRAIEEREGQPVGS
ncbi:MAG: hypothetical protein B9S32_01165 [Verrucomicrobia bacterium Tous-C9LFEB]|nr:MAG: hypothetical protein B9S32_01165 [Verrucomicrobia bacterium Tous-C9LFEB]